MFRGWSSQFDLALWVCQKCGDTQSPLDRKVRSGFRGAERQKVEELVEENARLKEQLKMMRPGIVQGFDEWQQTKGFAGFQKNRAMTATSMITSSTQYRTAMMISGWSPDGQAYEVGVDVVPGEPVEMKINYSDEVTKTLEEEPVSFPVSRRLRVE